MIVVNRLVALLPALLLTSCYDDTCDPRYCVDLSDSADRWVPSRLRSTLSLDQGLSIAEQDAAVAAVGSWRSAFGDQVQIDLVLVQDVPEYSVVRRAHPGVLSSGMLAATTGSVIDIGDGLEASGFLRPALVHEFGHYLGLGHEPDLPDDIMYPCTHEGMPTEPTPDALHDLRVLYGSP